MLDLLSRLTPRRWWTRLLAGTVLAILVATISALVSRERTGGEGERETAAAIVEADRTDPEWRWDALNAKRPRPPEGKNGAERIPQVKAQLPKGWGQKLNSDWDALNVPANVRFPTDVIDEAKRECEAAKGAIATARSLKDCPFGLRILQLTPDVLSTLLPDTQDTRLVVNLLKWDVVLAVESEDRARAADSIEAMLATSRSLGDETFLISQLVRIACRNLSLRSLEWALAQSELPVDRLRQLRRAFQQDSEEPILLYALRGERAAMDVLMQNLTDGTVNLATWKEMGDSNRGPFGRLAWWYYRGARLPGDRARMLSTFNSMIEVARLPIDEQVVAFPKESSLVFDDHHRIHKMLFPSVEKVAQATWRSAAEVRCAVAGLACEEFRMKTGLWPESLAALVPEYLPEVPRDPFNGMPMRFKRLPDGLVIYSLGTDRTDEGGLLKRPDSPQGTDEGFRLLDRSARRKPAPPKPPEPKIEP